MRTRTSTTRRKCCTMSWCSEGVFSTTHSPRPSFRRAVVRQQTLALERLADLVSHRRLSIGAPTATGASSAWSSVISSAAVIAASSSRLVVVVDVRLDAAQRRSVLLDWAAPPSRRRPTRSWRAALGLLPGRCHAGRERRRDLALRGLGQHATAAQRQLRSLRVFELLLGRLYRAISLSASFFFPAPMRALAWLLAARRARGSSPRALPSTRWPARAVRPRCSTRRRCAAGQRRLGPARPGPTRRCAGRGRADRPAARRGSGSRSPAPSPRRASPRRAARSGLERRLGLALPARRSAWCGRRQCRPSEPRTRTEALGGSAR